MAGLAKKLVNKLARRSRSTKEKQRGQSYDKENKLELVMAKSPRAYSLMRRDQRRLDSSFGQDVVAKKPVLARTGLASAAARVVYLPSPSGHGVRLTMAANLEASIGFRPGDVVRFRSGVLKNQELAVLAVIDSTHVMLEDMSSYTSESNVYFRALVSSEKASYK